MTKVKSYGKLNLSLNILGTSDGYHNLESVVCSINVYDKIIAKKRKDDKIFITFVDKYGFIPENQEDTLAYKTAKAFITTFNTNGVDIEIQCQIKPQAGLGSGSADIAGILNALKRLYKVKEDVKPIADSLGSDSGYQLKGGFAKISGRGQIVESFNVKNKLYFVGLLSDNGISTKDCYNAFDKENYEGTLSKNEQLIKDIIEGDILSICKNVNNALLEPAKTLNSEISKNIEILNSLNPLITNMTGSGSMVYSMYETYELSRWAYNKLKQKYGEKVVFLESVQPK